MHYRCTLWMHHNILSKEPDPKEYTLYNLLQTSRKCKLIITDKNKWLFGDRGGIGRKMFFQFIS